MQHRIVIVLESEGRSAAGLRQPPKFAVGGARASKDPRGCLIEELFPIAGADSPIKIPKGELYISRCEHLIYLYLLVNQS